MIKVEWLDIRRLTEREAALVAERMPARYERAKGCLHEEDRLRCIGAGLLMLRLGLRDETDIAYGPHGKPEVAYLPPFNLSHSGDFVVMATGEGPRSGAPAAEVLVGVDVERPRPCKRNVAARVFTAQEIAWMDQEDSDQRFCQLWTCKEAVMKLFGEGFHMEPRSFDVMALVRGDALLIDGVEVSARFEEREGHTLCATTTAPGA